MMEGSLITAGIAFSYWLDLGFSYLNTSVAWRFPIAFQMVFAIIICIFIMDLPESPRWLILKGREDEAMDVFAALSDLSVDDPFVHAEFTAVKDTVLDMQKAKFSDLFLCNEDRNFHRAVLGYVNQMFQQITGMFSFHSRPLNHTAEEFAWLHRFGEKNVCVCYTSLAVKARVFTATQLLCQKEEELWGKVAVAARQYQVQLLFKSLPPIYTGINLITYYAATIYETEIGLSPSLSRILAACNGTEYFLASWIAVFIIEKVGRRKLMLFGAVGQSLSMVVLAITTKIGGTGPGIVAAAFLFIFNTFFAIGWLGMTWLYPAEIVPLKIRAPANGLSTSANWIWNFMVVMITPVSFSSIGYQTYIIFAVM